MKIVVTGGNGNVGRHLVKELLKAHEVRVVDMCGTRPPGVEYVEGDLLDIELCKKALDGADVAIHLAAIPHPLSDPHDRVWRVNTCSTYNIHEAAVQVGVRRVIQASSDSTLGFCFMERPMAPLYLPIDEEHPCRPQDSYGLGKLVGEQIAQSYTRRAGLETVALRICLVLFPDVQFCRDLVKRRLSDEPMEKSKSLYVYNHVFDVARAFQLAAEAPSIEHEVMFISAADLCSNEPTLDLFRRHFPSVTEIRADLSGHKTIIDYSKAAGILGYEPKHSWREIPAE